MSSEFRVESVAHDYAEKKSREDLGAEFTVQRLVRKATYSSKLVTTRNDTT